MLLLDGWPALQCSTWWPWLDVWWPCLDGFNQTVGFFLVYFELLNLKMNFFYFYVCSSCGGLWRIC
ncbi:unnamed protein product [Meloidogyne enterolobii]|uniref:Uncharacterized protein n=1 Tax=Meloidogyne enterolobii TaxID=390850 RepID=A0ACB1A4T7_MELEN